MGWDVLIDPHPTCILCRKCSDRSLLKSSDDQNTPEWKSIGLRVLEEISIITETTKGDFSGVWRNVSRMNLFFSSSTYFNMFLAWITNCSFQLVLPGWFASASPGCCCTRLHYVALVIYRTTRTSPICGGHGEFRIQIRCCMIAQMQIVSRCWWYRRIVTGNQQEAGPQCHRAGDHPRVASQLFVGSGMNLFSYALKIKEKRLET